MMFIEVFIQAGTVCLQIPTEIRKNYIFAIYYVKHTHINVLNLEISLLPLQFTPIWLNVGVSLGISMIIANAGDSL